MSEDEELPEEFEDLSEEEKEVIKEIREKSVDWKDMWKRTDNGLQFFVGWMLTEFIDKYGDALGSREMLALGMFREYFQDELEGTPYLTPLVDLEPTVLEKLYIQTDVEEVLDEEELEQLEEVIRDEQLEN